MARESAGDLGATSGQALFSPSHRPLKRCGDACESVSVGAVEASVRSSLGVGVGVRDTHLAYICAGGK